MAQQTEAAQADGLADATGVAASGADSAPGMPQLNFDHFGNQIFWLLVALVAIYFILSRIALPRIAAILAERQGTISNDLAKAEDLKKKSIEAEKAYEKALADARSDAQKIADETREEIKADVAEAQKKADARIEEKTAESEKQIADIRASAMENVEKVAKDTAEALVAALGGTADSAQVSQAVDQRMKG